jgi:hypothetical protein
MVAHGVEQVSIGGVTVTFAQLCTAARTAGAVPAQTAPAAEQTSGLVHNGG